jgi:hypothetical protein
MFSDVAGAPTDGPLLDNDPGLYDLQKSQKATLGFVQQVKLFHCLEAEDMANTPT